MTQHRVDILHTGHLWWSTPVDQPESPHPVFSYLISTASGRRVLVDTGNPRTLIGKEIASPWFGSRVRMDNDHDIRRQIERVGATIEEVDLLVSTHFDFDHCGNHDLFDATGMPSLVHRAHLEEARADSRYDSNLWDRPGIGYQLLDGDYEVEPGLVLLETPGHCDGHLSLYVETADGPVILAVDAIDDRFALGSGPFPAFYYQDRTTWERSRHRLLDLQLETGATILFGHEASSLDISDR